MFSTLPQHFALMENVGTARHAANIVPEGDFEDVARAINVGWKHYQHPPEGVAATRSSLPPNFARENTACGYRPRRSIPRIRRTKSRRRRCGLPVRRTMCRPALFALARPGTDSQAHQGKSRRTVDPRFMGRRGLGRTHCRGPGMERIHRLSHGGRYASIDAHPGPDWLGRSLDRRREHRTDRRHWHAAGRRCAPGGSACARSAAAR